MRKVARDITQDFLRSSSEISRNIAQAKKVVLQTMHSRTSHTGLVDLFNLDLILTIMKSSQ